MQEYEQVDGGRGGVAETGTLAGGERQAYEQVDVGAGVGDPTYMEVGGGGENTFQLKENEAYAGVNTEHLTANVAYAGTIH